MPVFDPSSLPTFQTGYPTKSFKLAHVLKSHPLLEIERFIELGHALPPEQIEYISGSGSVDQSDSDQTGAQTDSLDETLRHIADAGSWIALRNIETDPAYKALMDECLVEVLPFAEAATGPAIRPEGFIFISSPDAVTPFHFDPDHNILMQVHGEKCVHVFPANDEQIVSAPQHEAYHAGAHCNLQYDEEHFSSKGVQYLLKSGEALHIPVKAPHWVKNGSEVSISFSITWRSDMSDRQRRIYLVNKRLRDAGLVPSVIGAHPLSDQMKDLAAKILGRVRML